MSIYQEIFDKNTDLIDRVKGADVECDFIKSDDVCVITLDRTEEYDSIETADGLVIIHYNPDSLKITGFTLPYVKEFTKTVSQLIKEKSDKPKISASKVATFGLTSLNWAY